MPPEIEVDDVAADIRSSMEHLSTSSDGGTSSREIAVQEVPAKEPAQREVKELPAPGAAARDASGKFAPKVPAVASEGTEDTAPAKEGADAPRTEDAEGQPNTTELALVKEDPHTARPPVSWTPEARESWKEVPAKVRAEVHRREREITETLRTTAEARRFAGEVAQTLQPYMHMIQAENATPTAAIQSLFQTAAALRVGTPQARAETVAAIVKQYGVDIQMLDGALNTLFNGQAPTQQSAAQQPDISAILAHPSLQPLVAAASTLRGGETQAAADMEAETMSFLNDPANEFAWDLKEEMAAVFELASRRGQKISLQDAYSRAIVLHPTISGIVQNRKKAQNGEQETAAARRARLAAVSIGSDGAPGQSGEDDSSGSKKRDDMRSDILSAITLSGSRTR